MMSSGLAQRHEDYSRSLLPADYRKSKLCKYNSNPVKKDDGMVHHKMIIAAFIMQRANNNHSS